MDCIASFQQRRLENVFFFYETQKRNIRVLARWSRYQQLTKKISVNFFKSGKPSILLNPVAKRQIATENTISPQSPMSIS